MALLRVRALKTRLNQNALSHAPVHSRGGYAASGTILMRRRAAEVLAARNEARRQLQSSLTMPGREHIRRLWQGEGTFSAEAGARARRGSAHDGHALGQPARDGAPRRLVATAPQHWLESTCALCAAGVQWRTRRAPRLYASVAIPYSVRPHSSSTRPPAVGMGPALGDAVGVDRKRSLAASWHFACHNVKAHVAPSLDCR